MDERDELTHEVIGAAIEVHRVMGPGLLEPVYQACLEQELRIRNLTFLVQHKMPIAYKGTPLDKEYQLDIYFPNQLVVELKAVEKLIPVHEAQLLTYMRLTNTRVGLLLNFNVSVLKDGLRRMVL